MTKRDICVILLVLIQVTLIVLKLCNVIAWHWMIVLMPLMLCLSGVVMVAVFIILIVGSMGKHRR